MIAEASVVFCQPLEEVRCQVSIYNLTDLLFGIYDDMSKFEMYKVQNNHVDKFGSYRFRFLHLYKMKVKNNDKFTVLVGITCHPITLKRMGRTQNCYEGNQAYLGLIILYEFPWVLLF